MFGTPDTVIQTHVSILTAKSPVPQFDLLVEDATIINPNKIAMGFNLTDTLYSRDCFVLKGGDLERENRFNLQWALLFHCYFDSIYFHFIYIF